jgi:hypothetical protein
MVDPNQSEALFMEPHHDTAIVAAAPVGGFVANRLEVWEANGQSKTEAVALDNLHGSVAFVLECRREQVKPFVSADARQVALDVA